MLKYRVTRSSSTSALATKPDSVVVNDTASVASSKDSAYCSEMYVSMKNVQISS